MKLKHAVYAISVFMLVAPTTAIASGLEVSASKEVIEAKTGDITTFTTTLTNPEGAPTGDILVAMNIVNIGSAEPVDPEDWSPQRAQSLASLPPVSTVTLNWTLFSILSGDYLVYVVAMQVPADDRSTQPVSGPAIHLTVSEAPRYNPQGVLPISIGVPTLMFAVWFVVRAWRHRQFDVSGSRS